MEGSLQLRAVGGIAYYMSPLQTLKEAILDPIHTAVYITFMLSACALFSKTWVEVSGSGPPDVSKQLKDQQMVMAGHREGSMYQELKRVMPTPAAFGGAISGLVSLLRVVGLLAIGLVNTVFLLPPSLTCYRATRAVRYHCSPCHHPFLRSKLSHNSYLHRRSIEGAI
jgi:preprotein translocase subunit SecY